MIGGAGVDTLTGGNGDDILNGQEGNDNLDGGTGNDIFAFAANFGRDRITGFDSNPNGGQDYLDWFSWALMRGILPAACPSPAATAIPSSLSGLTTSRWSASIQAPSR